VNSTRPEAKLTLCGFVRIHLQANQGARFTMSVPVERFRSWDTAQKQYTVEPGEYELMVGAASDDIRLRTPLKVTATP